MTPAARIAAAIDILDAILAGAAAEKTLTGWARQCRYAGSGDRAAIRDHVFDALRCRRSFGWLGGADSGRGLMLGGLRDAQADPDTYFTGAGYAPPALSPDERETGVLQGAPLAVRLDLPDWLLPQIRTSLGDDLQPVAAAMRRRAPVFLRINLAKTTSGQAAEALAKDGIATEPAPLSPTALRVTANPRRVRQCRAYLDGLVELQDAASQAVVDLLPPAARVLDYCAGGGGKSLAIAAQGAAQIVAHDANPERMRDLPARAARAGAAITRATTAELPAHGPYDLVFCDAPCSGSGAWRRSPDAKWRLTPQRLRELTDLQAEILHQAMAHVAPQGHLAYATCSLLGCENAEQTERFLRRDPGWRRITQRQFTPLDGGDGFYVVVLTKAGNQS